MGGYVFYHDNLIELATSGTSVWIQVKSFEKPKQDRVGLNTRDFDKTRVFIINGFRAYDSDQQSTFEYS